MSSGQQSSIMQALDAVGNKAIEVAGNLLDEKAGPMLSAIGDKFGAAMDSISLDTNSLKSGLAGLNPLGKGKEIEGPSIEKSISPGMEQDVASVSGPQRNEKFDALLANNGVQKANYQVQDMSADYSLMGATAVSMGIQQNQGVGMAV